MLIFINILII
eukprot:gene22377-28973_t